MGTLGACSGSIGDHLSGVYKAMGLGIPCRGPF